MKGFTHVEFKKFINCSFDVQKNEKDNIGNFTGYAALFDVNVEKYGAVTFRRGAFQKALTTFKSQGRNIPMFWEHRSEETIGSYDPQNMRETDKGLQVTGSIDLDVRRGYEAYSLLSKKMISGLSVGGYVKEEDVVYTDDNKEEFINFNLYEISVTPSPAIEEARVDSVFSASKALSMMPNNTDWNESKAIEDIRRYTNSIDRPSLAYKDYFFCVDETKPHLFSSYKYPFVYLSDNELKVVPKALQNIKNSLNFSNRMINNRGKNHPDSEFEKILNLTNQYI